MRLVRKLVLAIFVTFLPVLGIIEYLTVSHERRLSEVDARHDLALLGRVLAFEIERDWAKQPEDGARRAIEAANRADPLARARWLAEGEAEPLSDATRIEVRVPVVVDGAPRGTIAVSESADRLSGFVRARVLRLTSLTGALLVVSLGIAFTLGARLVGARLARLVEHARRVGSNDLEGRIEIGGRDEISALAEQMNAMTAALASARASAETADSERVQALSQLRHADRLASIGRLASAFAHELGTPLNVVLGRAKLISSPDSDLESAAKNAEIIRGQAQRMTETIRGLLGFARRAPTTPSRIDLYAAVREAIGLIEPLARHKSVSLVNVGTGDAAFVLGQRGELEQIVTNLLTNAIDALEPRGTVSVEVTRVTGRDLSRPVRADAVFHRLTIRDDGPGIPDADLPHVFEPFYTTKAEGRGTGLGLWIVDGIVRDHGGWVDVESGSGAGTSFSIHFPDASA